MGVRGLRKFIKKNQGLMKDFELCGAKLVIDGNNLLYHLFDASGTDYLHGGDYMQYAAQVQAFFQTLQSCHVSPFIVFDGGHDPGDLKLQKRLSRAKDRIADVERLKTVPPLLIYEVFRQVVDNFGIPFVVCDLDADHDAAVLANDMSCPLLSFDSDFFVFKLQYGLIPFETLDMNVVYKMEDHTGSSKTYLKCKIYFSDALSRFFPRLGSDAVILMATLLGNDHITRDLLYDFYRSLRLGPARIPLKFERKETDILKLFNWLLEQEDLTTAIDEVIQRTRNPEKRGEVRAAIMTSIDQYTLEPLKCKFRLSEHFDDHAQKRDVKSYEGNAIPEWVKRWHETGKISMVLQNIIVLRRNIFMSQMEDIRSMSSYRCAVPIRKILYGILTSSDSDPNRRIKEIDRDGQNVEEMYLAPATGVPKLCEIPNLTIDERQTMFLETLGLHPTLLRNLPDDAKLLTSVIRFVFHNSQPSMDENHVHAMLCCLFAINIKLQVEDMKGFGLSMIKEVISGRASGELEDNMEYINVFLGQERRADKRHTRINVIDAFAQYQACFMAAFDLNQILMCPFPNVNPAEIIHGTLLHNMYLEFERKSSPDHRVNELLHGLPELSELYNKMLSLILS
ncbi:hypothetical protein FSP39_019972 [Pinctada imbricata]|uniref:Uncharacterized protein n=1 Tax=Pinctada imbricata TaxID=66713 RepID=A0AA88XS88_PINIB|nr:hypothetical protein FSP39_019972 [Pinctada imbricata]